jgi:hypothetical protein
MDNVLFGALAAPMEAEALPARDLFAIAQNLVPTDAYLIQGRLVASGIPAVLADANYAQAYALASTAVSGVRVLVPESYLRQAGEVLQALARGDFALSDDADVGDPA